MQRISLVLFLSVAAALGALAACNKPSTPSPEQAVAVDKVVRDMIGGYTSASTGNQASAALEAASTPSFVESLKAKAKACSAGTAGINCDIDPITCTQAKATLTTVVVQAVSATDATATAVVTPEGGAPINVKVTLAGAPWKVSTVECPR